jgi:tetratricopeptide (TPR) repeat protein
VNVLVLHTPLLVLALSLPAASADDGREGNRLYREGRYSEAAAAFEATLMQRPEQEAGPDRSDLLNNLASALYRQNQFERARSTFVQSLAAAQDPSETTRAAYNAGNSSFRLGELEAATSFYQQALLADPANRRAKVNYEFVRRQMGDQPENEDQQQSGEKPEPSEYARALKAEADRMVSERRYRDAYDLLMEGLRVDQSVSAYQEFIGRTASIADIDQPTSGT